MRLCPKLDNLSTSSRRSVPPALTDQQAEALDAIRAAQGFAPFLLHGVTGSGKTEVYLHALAALLDAAGRAGARAGARNQPDAAVRGRVSRALRGHARRRRDRHAAQRARRRRTRAQLARRIPGARIVLGTRLAVLASLPMLA
jgi:primosomal protein N' (replication factor Y)